MVTCPSSDTYDPNTATVRSSSSSSEDTHPPGAVALHARPRGCIGLRASVARLLMEVPPTEGPGLRAPASMVPAVPSSDDVADSRAGAAGGSDLEQAELLRLR